MAFVIDKSKCRPCKCGCGELTSGIRKYRNGKYFYPEYCHGHHMVGKSGTSHPTFGKPSWNAGLTKDVSPTLAKMGYQPGHQPYNDFSKINNLLKSDPDFKEKWRLAKKGKTPWNKLKPFDAIRKEKHWNWKGGKPSHPRDYADYKLFRKKCTKEINTLVRYAVIETMKVVAREYISTFTTSFLLSLIRI